MSWKGPVILLAGAALPLSGPGLAGPCAHGNVWDPGRWGLAGNQAQWALQALSSLPAGPASCCSRGCGGRVGRAHTAGRPRAPLLLSFRPAPPRCSVRDPEAVALRLPARGVGRCPLAGLGLGLLRGVRLKPPGKERASLRVFGCSADASPEGHILV